MDTVLDRHDLKHSIDDLERIKVEPFDVQTARGMIKAILDRYRVTYAPDHVEKILEEVGTPVPYFLQLMLRNIVDKADDRAPLTDDAITRSYEGILADEREYFRWYYDRLGVLFASEPLRSAVMRILDLVALKKHCQEPDLKTAFLHEDVSDAASEFGRAMHTLEIEFYVVRDTHYAFASKVLRDWWVRERGLV